MQTFLFTQFPIIEACALALIGTLIYLRGWYHFWKQHAKKFSQSGYRPPTTGWGGRLAFELATRLVVFLTVGRVTIINRHKSPKKGHVIFAANHQLPCDFAMLRQGSNRHFRMLTASDELKGFLGVLGAWMGVISVAYKQKSDGAAAEAACVNAVAEHDGSLGIFPEGALLPDNPHLTENFRPGAVRIARAAAFASFDEPVQIVPIAIYYKHDHTQADWTQRFFGWSRSAFLGTRNPRHWDPIFKVNLDELNPTERADVEAIREAKLKGYRKAKVTNYGGVIVVGDPINAKDLPADPIVAINQIRDVVANLLVEAKKH